MPCALFVVLHRACDLSIYPRVNALCRLALRFAVLVMLACFLLTYLNKREKTEWGRGWKDSTSYAEGVCGSY